MIILQKFLLGSLYIWNKYSLYCFLVTGSARHEKLMIPGLPGGTKPGAGRIGRQIADEMLESSRSVSYFTLTLISAFIQDSYELIHIMYFINSTVFLINLSALKCNEILNQLIFQQHIFYNPTLRKAFRFALVCPSENIFYGKGGKVGASMTYGYISSFVYFL